jgi:uncharacterized protein YwqG
MRTLDMNEKDRARFEADRKKLRELALAAKLDADVIEKCARVALELIPHPLPKGMHVGLGYSRFGGQPDLPEGDDEWPGEMQFLFQMDFAELAELGDIGLPKSGHLMVWVLDGEDDDGDYLGTSFVQLEKGGQTLCRVSEPKGVSRTPAFLVEFAPRLTIPHPDTSEANALNVDRRAYNDIVYAGMPTLKHQLLGHKNTDQDDDADEALLLSFGTDKRLKWAWGDDNRLNFHIAKKHLSKKKLDQAYTVYIDA